jgi:hypothetical protein
VIHAKVEAAAQSGDGEVTIFILNIPRPLPNYGDLAFHGTELTTFHISLALRGHSDGACTMAVGAILLTLARANRIGETS